MIARGVTIGLTLTQAALGGRVALRLLSSARGSTPAWPAHGDATLAAQVGSIAVIVPALNEIDRLGPCLSALAAQGPLVSDILVIDGGSTDGTPVLARLHAQRDPRIRVIEAGAAPPNWNGKVWGLQVGLEHVPPTIPWLLTIDADVRVAPTLADRLLTLIQQTGLTVLSLATTQEIEGAGEGLVHPALLTTLVYRFGIPGQIYQRASAVQANGQCFLVRRDALMAGGGFIIGRHSVCEDVTLARALTKAGHRVGFFEAGPLASVRMYRGWRETLRNWPRSLPMRDQFARGQSLLGWLEVTLVQALPLLLLVGLGRRPAARSMRLVNLILVALRLGVLLGTARAYRRRPWTYWLSPLLDGPAAALLWWNGLRRRHVWRGRVLVRGEKG